jgi:hypothetical protein
MPFVRVPLSSPATDFGKLSEFVEKVADKLRELYGLDITHVSSIFDGSDFDFIAIDRQKIKYSGKLQFQLDIAIKLVHWDILRPLWFLFALSAGLVRADQGQCTMTPFDIPGPKWPSWYGMARSLRANMRNPRHPFATQNRQDRAVTPGPVDQLGC